MTTRHRLASQMKYYWRPTLNSGELTSIIFESWYQNGREEVAALAIDLVQVEVLNSWHQRAEGSATILLRAMTSMGHSLDLPLPISLFPQRRMRFA